MTTTELPPVDRAALREWFPSLSGPTVFLENAGGSQVPAVVADAIRDYMLTSYVQLEAGYPESDRADAIVAAAHDFVNLQLNGTGRGEVVLGPSSSQLLAMLAGCYAKLLRPGDEVVVTQMGHEANVSPWARLAERGVTVRTWELDPEAFDCPLEGLDALLNERTRVVAVVHVSNLLGQVVDVAEVARRVHAASPAQVVVDGVAYAPHRALDVAAWDVDFYAYSTYKVYGPHMAALWGKHGAWAPLTGPNHDFIPADAVPYKFELGGVSHEGCAGLVALGEYYAFLAGGDVPDAAFDDLGHGLRVLRERAVVERAGAVMEACERPLKESLLACLAARDDVRLVGPPDGPDRVPTVSFTHATLRSAEVARRVHAKGYGIRHGHNYAWRLCAPLGLDEADGVVRVSAVHYNTPEEIAGLCAALDEVL